jgi:ribosomal-protein-alanine N-acetyltransferase
MSTLLRLQTARLELVASDGALALLDAAYDHAGLAAQLGAVVTAEWPPELTHDVLDYFAAKLTEHPEQAGWWGWFIILDTQRAADERPRSAVAGERATMRAADGAAELAHAETAAAASGAARVLIGGGGFKGPPQADGVVEIGYSILPTFQRRGFATEAMSALVTRAFAEARVTMVVAETFPESRASQRVMIKLGMRQLGPGEEAGTIRFGIRRAEHAARA